MNRIKLVTALAAGLISTSAFAGAVVQIDNPNTVPCDTGSGFGYGWCSSLVPNFEVNFSGNNYPQVQIMNNGTVLLFDWGIGHVPITPLRLPNPLPDSVAMFSGATTYGAIDYDGSSAFAITWDYSPPSFSAEAGSLRNIFQLVLVDRGAGDFDFIFNYDSVQWDSHRGWDRDTSHLISLDVYSYVGYGVYPFHGYTTHPDSLNVLNTSQLPYYSWNSDVAGRYVFEVRDGIVTNPLPILMTLPPIPEPETWAMLLAGLGIVGAIARRRRATA